MYMCILRKSKSIFKILKLYAWETSFEDQVLNIRQEELILLRKENHLAAVSNFLWVSAPFFVAVASFAAYVLSDPNHVLSPTTAFVSLSLFNMLRMPMQMLPMTVTLLVQVRKTILWIQRL